ncbi:hypothetical protein [Pseudoalteromonas ruthenica]|uniref:hypothetical protein n=1 Tax=Pseudoalteromonas ruthenica TaxID=151081 RepID=UPI00110B6C1F|nr:hypothetical protein [Pseudoalteromonas ruthenica]TMP23794.1 hypothetical protein CWC06_09585 [Pseudoalteromonas ruthenica]
MKQKEKMPKKLSTDRTHIEAGLTTLKALKRQGESDRALFVKVIGREPRDQSELNTFSNRLNLKRGNPGLDFLGMFAKAYPEIRDMTIGELLGIDSNKNESKTR